MRARILDQVLNEEQKELLFEAFEVNWLEQIPIFRNSTFVLSPEAYQDRILFLKRCQQPLTPEPTSDEIQVWNETDKELEKINLDEVYKKVRMFSDNDPPYAEYTEDGLVASITEPYKEYSNNWIIWE